MTVYDLLLSVLREVEERHNLDPQRDIRKNGVGK